MKVYSDQVQHTYLQVQKVHLISMCSWIFFSTWDMVMEVWGFSLERILDAWHLLYKSYLQKYTTGIINIYHWYILLSVKAHLVFLGIWLMVFVVHVWEIVPMKWLWSGWCIERLYISKGLMSSPCEGYYTCHDYTHLYGTWTERYRCT
jgi:hypothetical protein